MRKRTLISVLITLIVIFCTNKFWLILRPMPVDFVIRKSAPHAGEVARSAVGGYNSCNIEIQLNKKDDDRFKRVKKQSIEINLEETDHAYFMVNRAKKPKRLRIIFSNLEAPVKISKIQMREGKFKPDLNKFISNGKLEVKNDSLVVYPDNNPVILDYKDSLSIRSAIKFNFKIFVIIAVLTFLFAYKISNYVADFKSVEKKSRIEIIFLTLFFIFLFIPMSHINQDEISEKENRTLAKWKPLIQDEQVNLNFGKDFNEWFNDRFNLRSQFVKLYTKMKYSLSNEYYEVGSIFLNKKTKWMCKKPAVKMTYTPQDYEEIIYSLKKLQEFCKKNNIKPYIIVSPTKFEIYNDKLYPFANISDNYEEKSKLFDEVKKQSGIEIIYPFNELKELSKTEYAFFKTDHHWTDVGAFEAYKLVMKQIKKDFPNVYVNDEKDFDYFYSNKVRVEPSFGFYGGRTYEQLGFEDESIFDMSFKYLKHKGEKQAKLNVKPFDGKNIRHNIYEYEESAPNMVLFGDSFTQNLLPSIVYSFNKTKNIFIWIAQDSDKKNYDFELQKDEILENNPQLLIICFCRPERLKDLFPKENN